MAVHRDVGQKNYGEISDKLRIYFHGKIEKLMTDCMNSRSPQAADCVKAGHHTRDYKSHLPFLSSIDKLSRHFKYGWLANTS